MQNLDKKGSILLWAVMLSLIVAISFISISSKINKNIKLSGENSNYNSEKTTQNFALFTGENTLLSENKVILFENDTEQIIALKQSEETTLSFSGNTDFTIDIAIVDGSGGAVSYNYINNNTSSSSGVLNYSASFSGTLDSTHNSGSLVLQNLGGYSKVYIKSELNFESTQKKYKIVQTIGNNTFIQTRGTK